MSLFTSLALVPVAVVSAALVQQPVRVGGDIPAPVKIKEVKPVYPREAQDEKIQGTVYLEAILATDGTVKELKVLSGPPALADAALSAVSQWVYTPTTINGEPVEVAMTVMVRFTLSGGSPAAEKPLRVGGNIAAPTKTKEVTPRYPPEAQQQKIEGVVFLEAIIAKDGRVRDVKAIGGPEILQDAAVAAVSQWEYTPTTINGKPIEVVMTVTVRFKLAGG